MLTKETERERIVMATSLSFVDMCRTVGTLMVGQCTIHVEVNSYVSEYWNLISNEIKLLTVCVSTFNANSMKLHLKKLQ